MGWLAGTWGGEGQRVGNEVLMNTRCWKGTTFCSRAGRKVVLPPRMTDGPFSYK